MMSDTPLNLNIKNWESLLEHLWEFDADYILGGGLAVSVWAERYLPTESWADYYLPLQSKDIDMRGTKSMVPIIRDWIRENAEMPAGFAIYTRKEKPELGNVFAIPITLNGTPTTIEILERFPLLDDDFSEPPQGSSLAIGHVRILDPFSLIVCKLHASNSRPPDERNNDVKHLRLLKEILPDFLDEALDRYDKGNSYHPKSDAQNLLTHMKAGEYPSPLDADENKSILSTTRRAVESY